jgi:2,5-furandicarboxylate decarboxylase 1
MADLRGFLERVEASGELLRITEELSTEYEIAAAIKYVAEKKGSVVLFERVKGYNTPVVANLFGSRRRMAMALGVEEERVTEVYRARRGSAIKPKMVTEAVVKEVLIEHDVDIRQLIPVLTIHEKDAGPYFGSALTIAKDPETGERGMGLHRIQVKGKDTLGIFLATPPLSDFVAKAEKMGKTLEVAIASGVAPHVFFSGCTPAPPGVNKFDVAGSLGQTPVELVKCHSVDVDIPADAEFVLEGELIPGHRELEGPFGESTGYYLAFNSPVAKIKVITHRRSPIYHALVPFGPEEDNLLDFLWGADFLPVLQKALPFVKEAYFRSFSGGMLIVQIEKRSEEDARKVIDYLLATPFVKVALVTDMDVNIWDPREVDWALTRVNFDKDLVVKSGMPGSDIDPSAIKEVEEVGFTPLITKIGIDATKPLAEWERFEKIDFPERVKQKVWGLLGELI